MPQPAHRGKYPKDWKAIATRVKDAAGWKCVRCSHPHDAKAGRCLTVHHFDGDKANCADWNLMALCQACHLSVQARVDPAQGLIGDASPWSMPYIVGMIAAGRTPTPLGYDLSRWKRLHAESGRTWPIWAMDKALVSDEPDDFTRENY